MLHIMLLILLTQQYHYQITKDSKWLKSVTTRCFLHYCEITNVANRNKLRKRSVLES